MKVELDIAAISFNGVRVEIDKLAAAVLDSDNLYRFTNDGKAIAIERFALIEPRAARAS